MAVDYCCSVVFEELVLLLLQSHLFECKVFEHHYVNVACVSQVQPRSDAVCCGSVLWIFAWAPSWLGEKRNEWNNRNVILRDSEGRSVQEAA